MSFGLSQKINFGIFAVVLLSMVALSLAGNMMVTNALQEKINTRPISNLQAAQTLDHEVIFYYTLQSALVVITLIALLVSFVFGMYISRKMVEPLRRLMIASQRLSHGDFDYKVQVTSKDEIGELAKSFNLMSASIQAIIEREKKLAAQTATIDLARRRAEELNEANEKILEKTEELKKVNAELDSFVYTASHDLRAPLRGISSFAQFLEDDYSDKVDEEGKEYLREIKEGANNLQELIEDLLTLSQISRIRNPYEVVSVKSILDNGLERLRLYIKDMKAQVVYATDFPTMRCDRIKMTEVFVNLINNGIKFASKIPGRTPKVEVGYEDEPQYYRFWIKDNGIGIDPRYHEQIFGIFKRLHTKAEYEGTGAGLTIVRKIIEEHQGKIWIESQEGEGAKFIFTVAKHIQDKKKLGEILIESGLITPEKLQESLKQQSKQV